MQNNPFKNFIYLMHLLIALFEVINMQHFMVINEQNEAF